MNRWKKAANWFVVICFLGFLLFAMIWTLLRDKGTYSYYENRSLAAPPEYSAQADGDGSYFSGWERYLSDHAAGRNLLLKAKTASELALGRPVVNDVVVTEEYLLPFLPFENIDREQVEETARSFAARLKEISSAVEAYGGYYCYVGVPCQYVYHEEEYPSYLNDRGDLSRWSTEALFQAAEELEVNYLDLVPVYEELGALPEYSSAVDNHYSVQGAFIAYQTILKQINGQTELNIPILSEDDLTFRALPNPYLGSRNRKLLGLAGNSEFLYVVEPKSEIPFRRYDNGAESAPTVYALPENDWQEVLYTMYMGGDIAETLIDTNREELPSVLIYGDSFTNALECILYLSFDEMRALDLRHYTGMTIDEYIQTYQPEVVLCIRDYESLLSSVANGQ